MIAKPAPDIKVVEYEYSETKLEDCLKTLARDGGVILRNVLQKDVLDQIERDLRPSFDADVAYASERSFPKETRRANGLIAKSETFVKHIVANKLYQDICTEYLTNVHKSWWGDAELTSKSLPILDATTCFSVGPGAKDQPLHRDCMIHHNVLPEITAAEYKPGRDHTIDFFIAGTKTTKANGATRFVPRSHLWGMERRPCPEEAVYAELNLGDGFIMLGSCFHGGSANTTADEERLVYGAFMTKGINRTEENQFLANTLEHIKRYDPEIQRLAGFGLSHPSLGWVDFKNPKFLIADDPAKYLPGYMEDAYLTEVVDHGEQIRHA
ncbi:phytanoyl-CoA dioxygenase family protein [Fonsecaea pedrosoi]|nr:phytanoyl-CoA dioxygenase family protein [Fonsecaea pedrosoi]